MKILALDTSTPISAVAIADGERVLCEDREPSADRHGAVLLPRIEAQLRASGLRLAAIELIAVGLGPGSFTGLRVGLATAKGLALALGVPICGVSSLEVLARGVQDEAALAVALLDAGRGELFAAAYAGAAGPAISQVVLAPARAKAFEMIARLDALTRAAGRAVLCGSGARNHGPELAAVLGERCVLAAPSLDVPHAGQLAHAALSWFRAHGASDLASLEPSYLRDSDAKLPAEPLAV